MKKKVSFFCLAGIVVIAGGMFLFSGKKAGGGMKLETEKVSRSSISNVVTATGTVEPVTEVDVGTQVSGIVSKLYADYNDVVTAGQLIAKMDTVTLHAELQSATAQLNKSKSEYEYQQKNYARNKVLYEKKLISDTDYETATYTYERRNLEYATITSPINGVIINRAVEEGQTVAAGFETPTLFTIAADLTKMQIIADVDEADIGSVLEGQRVTFTVDAYPNDVFEGQVKQIRLGDSSESSSTTSSTSTVVTYEVVISADNPDLKLKPRLTANITIYTMERNDVLVVPNKALRFIADPEMLMPLGIEVDNATVNAPEGKKIVWVKVNNRLEPKSVTVGSSNNNVTEVVSGLSEGEDVAVDLAAAASVASGQAQQERSPFMPGPPGSQKKAKK